MALDVFDLLYRTRSFRRVLYTAQKVVRTSASNALLPSFLPSTERTVATPFLQLNPLPCQVPSTETRILLDSRRSDASWAANCVDL